MDDKALVELVKGYTTPITNACLVIIPIVCLVWILVNGIIYFTKSEEEQQQKPFMAMVKKALMIGAICMSAPVLLKIFGIA